MKWIVAGAGALLSITGVYGLVIGESIIQVERGWATFIAGAVAGAAGLVIMAIAALIARVDRLASALSGAQMAPREETLEPAASMPPVVAPVAPTFAEPNFDEPRDFVARAPMFRDAPSLFVEPAPEPKPEPAAELEPVVEEAVETAERPAALRDFKFVFPPLEDEKTEPALPVASEPAPVVADEDKVEPLTAFDDKPANRFNLGWLRRNRLDEPAALRDEPPAFVEPAPAPQAQDEAQDEAQHAVQSGLQEEPQTQLQDDVQAELHEELQEEVQVQTYKVTLKPESPARVPAIAPEIVLAPVADIEPQPVWTPTVEAPRTAAATDQTPDPFSADWLERALAGTDETETAPQPFVPPSQRRAQTDETYTAPSVSAGEPSEQSSGTDEPVEIGRYSANDVAYVMYSDGSITADTAAGTFRFSSLIELKDFIERGA